MPQRARKIEIAHAVVDDPDPAENCNMTTHDLTHDLAFGLFESGMAGGSGEGALSLDRQAAHPTLR